jgi:uncharacterized protein
MFAETPVWNQHDIWTIRDPGGRLCGASELTEERSNETLEEKKRCILDLLLPRLDPYLLILFGSFAQGRERKESDIDIGFLSDKSLAPYEIFMVAQALASQLNRDVDLINLSVASTVFQAEILFCNDLERWERFAMKVLKMFAKLNEEREVVLRSIKESGTIYGS